MTRAGKFAARRNGGANPRDPGKLVLCTVKTPSGQRACFTTGWEIMNDPEQEYESPILQGCNSTSVRIEFRMVCTRYKMLQTRIFERKKDTTLPNDPKRLEMNV